MLAVQSAFTKLRNLYAKVRPEFEAYGFTPPSPGVIARDLSEKIESSIVQHCPSFAKGQKHCDLQRDGFDWEVKVCKDSGLTINQSKVINGENYIVANYRANTQVVRVWVLWQARDEFFSARRPNSNARALVGKVAEPSIEFLYVAKPTPQTKKAPMAKAALPSRRTKAV